ncbi:Asp23/Gls24 family envelope stress response protein [Streptomyces sp. TBY4]|uniref:Asp23/Gls24 family envelope stress response protein n=1 Tax=Streptomyces sp. TBY4 TaxID=2962030 RepID=UPI0020B666FE|nr:Asp23/Gls24 family envelope stress response protein [Streptomyces sp. TBY4]MCP3756761.1 Asp23/Gls24 family envelope stress response protein [Streptomyces sp. TBY4]
MSTPRPTPPRVPAAERGATRIADRVVAKIAARAAREALSRPAPEGAAPPYATVTVHHDIARVRVVLELPYPSDLAAQCAAVRRQVALRVEEYAEMAVPEVDVDVEHLRPARPAAGRDRRVR